MPAVKRYNFNQSPNCNPNPDHNPNPNPNRTWLSCKYVNEEKLLPAVITATIYVDVYIGWLGYNRYTLHLPITINFWQ